MENDDLKYKVTRFARDKNKNLEIPYWIIKQNKDPLRISAFFAKGAKKIQCLLRLYLKMTIVGNVKFLQELSSKVYFKDNFTLIKDCQCYLQFGTFIFFP